MTLRPQLKNLRKTFPAQYSMDFLEAVEMHLKVDSMEEAVKKVQFWALINDRWQTMWREQCQRLRLAAATLCLTSQVFMPRVGCTQCAEKAARLNRLAFTFERELFEDIRMIPDHATYLRKKERLLLSRSTVAKSLPYSLEEAQIWCKHQHKQELQSGNTPVENAMQRPFISPSVSSTAPSAELSSTSSSSCSFDSSMPVELGSSQ